MTMANSTVVALAIAALLTACAGAPSQQPIDAERPRPATAAAGIETLIPTVNIAPAKGWSGDQKPTAAAGMAVASYAAELDHPRWLYVLPNGDVLVAETNAPERPEDKKGIKGFFMGARRRTPAQACRAPNRITLLRDADGDGRAEIRSVFLKDLNSPFGMALVGNDLYVANTDAVLRFRIRRRRTTIDRAGHEGRRPAGRADQPSLDQEPDRERGRREALRHRRLEQQRRRERHGERGAPRRDPGDRSRDGRVARVRFGPAQSERPGLGAAEPTRSGPRSTSATSSATISCPTT